MGGYYYVVRSNKEWAEGECSSKIEVESDVLFSEFLEPFCIYTPKLQHPLQPVSRLHDQISGNDAPGGPLGEARMAFIPLMPMQATTIHDTAAKSDPTRHNKRQHPTNSRFNWTLGGLDTSAPAVVEFCCAVAIAAARCTGGSRALI